MSMMDLQAALGGPPGGGPPTIDVPPEAGPGGLPPEAPPEEPGGSSADALDAAEEALHHFIQIDPDEEDRAEAGKALQIILKLKATNQKSADSGDLKSLRKALAGNA